MIRIGKCWNGISDIFEYCIFQHSTNLYANVSSSLDIWHWGLGSPTTSISNYISTIDSSISFSYKICDICPLGKHVRNPLPSSNIMTNHLLN